MNLLQTVFGSFGNMSIQPEGRPDGPRRERRSTLKPFAGVQAVRWGAQDADQMMLDDAPHRTDNDAGEWTGVKKIGSGGFGTAMLFCRYDNLGAIHDRMVVKEQAFTRSQWYDPTQWIGTAPQNGHRDFDERIEREDHMEHHAHRRLAGVGTDLFPGLRGSSGVDHANWRFRIYNEWCPLGTLSDLIKYYQDKRNWPLALGFTEKDTKNTKDSGIIIPEPFIWMVWLRLTEAAYFLEGGWPKGDAEDNWTPIIHRDIKPGNVFLTEPTGDEGDPWQLYPRSVLADFGLCCESAPGDPNNPRVYRPGGTRNYKAPEQEIWQNMGDRDQNDSLKLSSATNVFGNAMVIYSLVYRGCRPELPDWSKDHMLVKPLPLPAPGYSRELLDLMHHCLRLRPAARPTLAQVRARIDPPAGNPHWSGMQEAEAPRDWPWYYTANPLKLAMKQYHDDYAVGFASEDNRSWTSDYNE